jgi:hypothetical protein
VKCRSFLTEVITFVEASMADPGQGDDLDLLKSANRRSSALRINFVSGELPEHFLVQYHTSDCPNMAAFSRGVRPFPPLTESICSKCLFSTTSTVQSGHNRWSKIKHDKGKADANKNAQRSSFSREIALCSKSEKPRNMSQFWVLTSIVVYGGDPNTNPRLASLLANAKKGI